MNKETQEKLEKELGLKYGLTSTETQTAVNAYSKENSYASWKKLIDKNTSPLKKKIKPKKRLKEMFDTIKKAAEGVSLSVDAEVSENDKEDEIRQNIEDRLEKKYNEDYTGFVSRQLSNDIAGGKAPWMTAWQPQQYADPCNPYTGHIFQGVNAVLLTSVQKNVFESEDPRWLTAFDAKKNGFKIKEGAKGYPVSFSKTINLNAQGYAAKEGEEVSSQKTVKNMYMLYHASQIDGIPPYVRREPLVSMEKGREAEAFRKAALRELAKQTGRKDAPDTASLNPSSAGKELRAGIASYLLCKALSVGFRPEPSSLAYPPLREQKNDSLEIFKAVKDALAVRDYCLNSSIAKNNEQKYNNTKASNVSRSR